MRKESVLVWDWPVRLGHWALVLSFVVAWLTSEGHRWEMVHALAGSAMLAIVAYRILWGVVGTRYARFAEFVRGRRATLAYLKGLLVLQPPHSVGHNPLGAWAIVLMLLLIVATAASGLVLRSDLGGHWVEELHEGLASTTLAVVVVHVMGVITASVLHRENLVRAMFTGRKPGGAGVAIHSARPGFGLLLVAWVAVAVWFLLFSG